MRLIQVAWIPVVASLLLFAGDAGNVKAHDGTSGYISWADIHWNASGTNHLEYDFYYTGHEGCQGDDACVFYVSVQRWVCGQTCSWINVNTVGHGTVHGWPYDHSAADGINPVPGSGLCLTKTHSPPWDCHNGDGVVQPCGYAYRHRDIAFTPYQQIISTGPYSNWVAKPC